MIRLVDDFKYYNANYRDRSTGDCVIRSLSLAYNMDYKAVASELHKIRRDGNYRQWNILPVYKQFIEKHGLVKYEVIEEDLTVGQFSEKYSTGIYLILCGKDVMKSTHIVCIIDGTIYDSWDCSKWSANKVFIVSEDSTNIDDNIDGAMNLADYAVDAIRNEISSYNLTYGKLIEDDNPLFNKYDFYICCTYDIRDLNLSDGTKDFEFEFMYKFSPRYSEDQNRSIIDKITKNYVKKYISDMNRHIKDVKDNEELHSKYQDKYTGSNREILNKLPFWCRKLMLKVIDRGKGSNEWTDRYYAVMQTLPEDPRAEETSNTVQFYAESIKELVYQINEYKKDFSRYGWDY